MEGNREVLENKLRGRGLTFEEFDILIPLRMEYLESIGKNPDDFNLDSRNITKKFGR